ncbi:hypothetical protein [Reichenbachiella sp.]
MKSFRSILLSIFFILSALVMGLDLCCEIKQVPNLIDHYTEHKAQDGDSFWDFLVEDYIDHGKGKNHHDENEHDDLPFHGNHQCQHTNILISSTIIFSVELDINPLEPSKGIYQFMFSSRYLETPFQPPRA